MYNAAGLTKLGDHGVLLPKDDAGVQKRVVVGGRVVDQAAACGEHGGLLGGAVPGRNGGVSNAAGLSAEAEVRKGHQSVPGDGLPRPVREVLQYAMLERKYRFGRLREL